VAKRRALCRFVVVQVRRAFAASKARGRGLLMLKRDEAHRAEEVTRARSFAARLSMVGLAGAASTRGT
jgi:hypothetical protein